MGELPEACTLHPTGSPCENAMVSYLDSARRKIGLGPYKLPADFTRLAPEMQILILTDLDRTSYGIAPAAGVVKGLDVDAAKAVKVEDDPLATGIPNGRIWGYAANWAGGSVNVLESYYLWMYDDGYPGTNIGCTSPSSPGCWDHRRDILFSLHGTTTLLGIASGWSRRHTRGDAMLIVAAQLTHRVRYVYSWKQAVARGAGRNRYRPGAGH